MSTKTATTLTPTATKPKASPRITESIDDTATEIAGLFLAKLRTLAPDIESDSIQEFNLNRFDASKPELDELLGSDTDGSSKKELVERLRTEVSERLFQGLLPKKHSN